MITRETLRSCYLAVLGRLPESAAIEEEKIRWTPDLQALVSDHIASDEFQARLPRPLRASYEHEAPEIEVDGSAAEMQALFERLRQQWQAMGESEPYWSVLTHDEYRTENLDTEARARFFASGLEHAHLLDLFASRCQVGFRAGTCVELGCGVGRVTQHLAGRFEKVIAIDISEGNLREARAMAKERGLTNIEFVLMGSPRELEQLPEFDVLYSIMVFQHNPPPVQKYQLDLLFSKLRRKGAFFVQLQTHAPGYRFRIEEHLAAPLDVMDMHSLPMHEVLALARKHRLPVHEVQADYFTGRFGSFTFFGSGPARRPLLSRLFG